MNSELDFADIFARIAQLEEIYEELNASINRTMLQTGLRCLPGCRSCCETPSSNIEVSILEFLPLSMNLWQNDKAGQLLEILELKTEDDPCVLLQNDASLLPEGGCSHYGFRPLMCRLFGFSAMIGRDAFPVPVICKLVKVNYPDIMRKVVDSVNGGLDIPVFSNFARRVRGIDPYLAERVYPINQALKKAIEFIGLRWHFGSLGYDKPA
ncbi:MAG TPA: YkgJ family cysteine cluster protein [Mesotoga sp.]|jgi:Fe-S-cluster containining protein|nr:YkgJ family cysteine cluster protein [Mesotoga sp.]MDI9374364.1 YkgJ family cysteine cluster protein [Thermotogota bacterium]NLX34899.1 YkgJ family cysteine cluster protein [Thermotogaceae bacterium]MDD4039927.1 YkgJ family cysteine cluster protein [Mesotoga sp.]MDD5743420.1 YkgJ family cysteine cluster protein [Mesotoga sp.]